MTKDKEIPKCPVHGKTLCTIFAKDDIRYCAFNCGCVLHKEENKKEIMRYFCPKCREKYMSVIHCLKCNTDTIRITR